MNTRKHLTVIAALLAFTWVGCKHEKPSVTFMPDMAFTPGIKAQAPGSMRPPVKGTVPREHQSYPYRDVLIAGKELSNPLRPTLTVLERGQKVYNTYCIVCHGQYGEGDGSVVPKYPRPPSLQSEKVRHYADGSIFHVITMGQNLMPSYASQISADDRWALIHYVRAIQKAKNPTAEDVKAAGQ